MNNLYLNKLTLPQSVNISIIKENNSAYSHFYIYNFLFFYKLPMPQNIKYSQLDQASNSIIFFEKKPNYFSCTFEHLFSVFLFSWNYYFFEKIKFTGKGYRITFRKKKKYIIFYFGHSHDTIMLFRGVKVKKPHKYKFIVLKNSFNKIKILGSMITKIKPINVYTKRGLRKSRQWVYKRKSNKATF